MSVSTAKKWTCDQCGVTVSRLGGEKVELPASWTSSREGTFCLLCRRELVGCGTEPDDSEN